MELVFCRIEFYFFKLLLSDQNGGKAAFFGPTYWDIILFKTDGIWIKTVYTIKKQ